MKKLYIVGVGSGNYDDLTMGAIKVLNLSELIYCDERIFQQLQAKIISVASTNFSIVFYGPCNSTYKNLLLAREILLAYRPIETIVGLAKGKGTEEQKLIITNLGSINVDDIDSYTTIFVGNKETKLTKTKKW